MGLNIKDKKILYELDRNSRIPLTKLAKKLQTSKEVVHYRIKNLIKDKIILQFHTVPASYRLGLIAYKVYLRLQDISKIKFDELIQFLRKNKDVFWIAVSKGRWDLIFGIWAQNIEDFFTIHDTILDKFSKYIQEKELSISRENIQYNRRWLYSDNSITQEFNFGEKEEQIKLNLEDKKILDSLIDNSRKKIIDIAKETKLSTDKVSYKIKQMEKKKIIRGYKTLWNASQLGYPTCKAFVYFKNITEEKKKQFIQYCKQQKNSINIVITFAPWDLEVMFETKDYESYYQIMDEIKEKFNTIVKYYESIIITSEPKQVFGK